MHARGRRTGQRCSACSTGSTVCAARSVSTPAPATCCCCAHCLSACATATVDCVRAASSATFLACFSLPFACWFLLVFVWPQAEHSGQWQRQRHEGGRGWDGGREESRQAQQYPTLLLHCATAHPVRCLSGALAALLLCSFCSVLHFLSSFPLFLQPPCRPSSARR